MRLERRRKMTDNKLILDALISKNGELQREYKTIKNLYEDTSGEALVLGKEVDRLYKELVQVEDKWERCAKLIRNIEEKKDDR